MTRLVAWSRELRRVHERLREALIVTQSALDAGQATDLAARDLLLLCHGFCTALTGHHEGEDRQLFPVIAAAHPELEVTLLHLVRDHSIIAYLVAGMQAAMAEEMPPTALRQRLDGIGAIMENHFRYEERMLLTVLESLELDAEPRDVLGPL